MFKQAPPALTASAIGPCLLSYKLVGRPGTGMYTQHLRTTGPPPYPIVLSHKDNEYPDYDFCTMSLKSVCETIFFAK